MNMNCVSVCVAYLVRTRLSVLPLFLLLVFVSHYFDMVFARHLWMHAQGYNERAYGYGERSYGEKGYGYGEKGYGEKGYGEKGYGYGGEKGYSEKGHGKGGSWSGDARHLDFVRCLWNGKRYDILSGLVMRERAPVQRGIACVSRWPPRMFIYGIHRRERYGWSKIVGNPNGLPW